MTIDIEDYDQTLDSLTEALRPEGVLEETFAAEIMAAVWRLRRCRTAKVPDDPAQQEALDRSRAHAHNILRRSLTELRKLQTEATIRVEIDGQDIPGLTDTRQVLTTLDIHDKRTMDPTVEAARLLAAESSAARPAPVAPAPSPSPTNSFCKTPANTPAVSTKVPRNAPCPCGSRMKYKRCCGNPAAPALDIAA
jgi:hypothetical protein